MFYLKAFLKMDFQVGYKVFSSGEKHHTAKRVRKILKNSEDYERFF